MGTQRNRKKLTEAQRIALEANPNVDHVSSCDIFYTQEFKDTLWREFTEHGTAPNEILRRHGFDVSLIGESRISGFLRNLKREHGWESQRKQNGKKEISKKTNRSDAALRKEVKQLEHKVELLTQQMEYIKKAIVLGRKEQ